MTQQLDKFTRGYIEAALWSSTAYGSLQEQLDDPPDAEGQHRGTFDSSFQHLNYDESDLSPELLAHIIEDCAAFQRDQAEDLELAYARYSHASEWTHEEQAGHDFWLTRNGHGAGFWGRGLGDVGERLSKAVRVYGEENWYVDRTGMADDDEAGVIRVW